MVRNKKQTPPLHLPRGRDKRTALSLFLILTTIGSLILVGNIGRVNAASRSFDYLVNIWMENKSCPSSLGSIGGSSTPYELSLATTYAYDNCHYSVIVNPSLPNYMGFWAGQYPGCATSDSDPSGCSGGSATNIVDRLEAAGLTWKAFAENYPVSQGCSGGYQSSGGGYYARHFPPVYYTDITNNPTRCANLINAGSGDANFLGTMNQASAWPNFIWLTPNGCDDTHDCSGASGDSWLATLVPKILSSTLFTTQNAALVVTWDEGYPVAPGPIFAGPAVKHAYVGGTTSYNHYNWLSTILANYGLSCISNDCGKTQMTEFFGQSSPPPPPALTASFTSIPTTVSIGTTVTFTGSASGGTSPYTFSWSLGDGSTATGTTATHSYSANGTYIVTLTVKDSASPASTATSKSTVTVGSPSPGASTWSSVDSDPEFNTAASKGGANSAYPYWHPNTHGASTNNAYVSGGVLHTVQNDTGSTSWASFDNAVAHEGNFPWQTDCGHVSGQPPNWACGRNTYGLSAPVHSGFPVDVSASLSYLAFKCGSSCEYDAFIGVYWYFPNGPVTGNGCTQYYMEEQIRLTSYHAGKFDAIGAIDSWCTFDFGYTTVATQLQPGQSYALNNYDLSALYQAGLSKWGLSSTTNGVLLGIEVGSEGYGATISTDWNYVRIQTFEQDAVRADVNFDWLVNSSDLTLVQSFPGPCPANYGTYQWRADANASNSCVNSDDVAYVTQYLGATIDPPASQAHDFSLAANPVSVSSNAGVTVTSSINVAPVNGFTGTVALTSLVSSSGLTCSLNPANLTLGSSQTSKLSCAGTAGVYTVTVTGTSNGITHTATVTVTIQDFKISASPTSITLTSGSSATSTITVSAQNGLSGSVSLTSNASTSGLTCGLSPASLSGSGTSTLNCSGSTIGTFTVTVTGNSGSLSHSTSVTVNVANPADFSLTASPNSATILAGATGTSTISIAAVNGFAGTISLIPSVSPPGMTCTLNPTSIVLGSSQTSTLSCTGSAGTYVVTVTGVSSGITHTATVIMTVQDFTMSASPSSTNFAQGGTGSSTVTVTAAIGFSGVVSLTSTVSPAGVTCTLTPTGVTGSGTSTLNCTGSTLGTFIVTISSTSGSLLHTTTITITVSVVPQPSFILTASPTSVSTLAETPGTSTITVAPVNGFTGTVALTQTVSPVGLTCTLSPTSIVLAASQSSALSCTGPAGTYTVTVTGTSGSLFDTATVSITDQDFAISPSPTNIAFNVGGSGTSTITTTPLDGFSGIVNFADSSSSASVTCNLSPTSVTGSGASTLLCSGSAAGSYILTIIGTSTLLSHSATVTVNVGNAPDYSVTNSSTSVSMWAGSTGTSTVTIAPLGVFTGTINLAISASPSSTSFNCGLNPQTINLGASQVSVLSCSGLSGTYSVTVTGTSGQLSHSGTIMFTVQDFNINANPASVSARAGDVGNSTITVSPVNGSTGAVALALNTSSSNLTCSLSSTSPVLGISQTSLLSCDGSKGTYNVTVMGTIGPLSRSTVISFTISGSNVAPIVNVPGPQTVTAGSMVSFVITYTDSNPNISQRIITLSALGVPLGASFNSSSGVFSWTPLSSTTGNFAVAFTATKASSPTLSDTKTVTISVQPASGMPCLTCWIGVLSQWTGTSMPTILLFVLGGTIGVFASLAVQTVRVRKMSSRLLHDAPPIPYDE